MATWPEALPRLAVGHLVIVTSLFVFALLMESEDRPTLGQFLGLDLGLTLVSLLLRGDVWALQFGRRVRYEISDTGFRAFQGHRERLAFKLEDVTDWTGPSAP